MNQDIEYGLPNSKNVLKLASGTPRNLIKDAEIFKELETRKKALRKYKLEDMVSDIIEYLEELDE